MSRLENMQIQNCQNLLTEVLGDNILGIYLYGSAIVGGLQKHSDIDLFVVLKHATSIIEKQKLIDGLLKVSGIYMKSEYRPIEMTIVVYKDINPWCYPPKFDFQYGEWLRDDFNQGMLEPHQSKEMPDLTVLITQLLLANKCLYGVDSETILPKIPYIDFMRAMTADIEDLKKESLTDTRNVLLALARVWATIETNKIYTKPNAALWAIERLPNELIPALMRARSICVGEAHECWQDIKYILKPCIKYMCDQISKHKQDCCVGHKAITLAT